MDYMNDFVESDFKRILFKEIRCIRKYIYDEQNGKCAICNMDDIWNGKKINFI